MLEERLTLILKDNQILKGDQVGFRGGGYWDPTPIAARAVLLPQSTEEVSRIVELCGELGQSVVIHGGLTGCAQGGRSTPNDVVISTERLNKIIEIDPVSQTVTVEAGVILETLQNQVAGQGLYLPLDLGARGSCTIGGNIATNAGGNNVLRYGMARALVVGLEGVLPDGQIVSSLNKYIKDNAGYDVKHILIGSEGTLGIVTRIVLRLEPSPTRRQTALLGAANFDAVKDIYITFKSECAANLTSFELMYRSYYNAVTAGHEAPPLAQDFEYYLLIELCDRDDGPELIDCLERVMERDLILDAVIAQSESQRDKIWEVRDNFEAIQERAPVFMYDVSLSLADMPDYIARVEDQLKRDLPKAEAFVFGHIGDGNLHLLVSAEGCGPDAHEVSDRAVYQPLQAYSGSVSGEHGIGHEKKAWLDLSRSSAEISLMRRLKQSIDPQNILNPGVVFDV